LFAFFQKKNIIGVQFAEDRQLLEDFISRPLVGALPLNPTWNRGVWRRSPQTP